jgi:hypothetical protein
MFGDMINECSFDQQIEYSPEERSKAGLDHEAIQGSNGRLALPARATLGLPPSFV